MWTLNLSGQIPTLMCGNSAASSGHWHIALEHTVGSFESHNCLTGLIVVQMRTRARSSWR